MIRHIVLLLIRIYQLFVSPLLGPKCRFSPTCSSYAAECIGRFGILHGSILTLKRLAKCHPWGPCGEDPPPETVPKLPAAMRKSLKWTGKF